MIEHTLYAAGGCIAFYWLYTYRLPFNLRLSLLFTVGWALAGATYV